MFEDKDKADKVAAVVIKQLNEVDEGKEPTEHVEIQETKSAV